MNGSRGLVSDVTVTLTLLHGTVWAAAAEPGNVGIRLSTTGLVAVEVPIRILYSRVQTTASPFTVVHTIDVPSTNGDTKQVSNKFKLPLRVNSLHTSSITRSRYPCAYGITGLAG